MVFSVSQAYSALQSPTCMEDFVKHCAPDPTASFVFVKCLCADVNILDSRIGQGTITSALLFCTWVDPISFTAMELVLPEDTLLVA
jgi:hypothetical protein